MEAGVGDYEEVFGENTEEDIEYEIRREQKKREERSFGGASAAGQ